MKYKTTFTKKYHFPGCQNGKEDYNEYIQMPIGALDKLFPPSLSWNADGIGMVPISADVFKNAEEVPLNPLNIVKRSVEIFSASPERKNDRASWVAAIQHIGRLTVKKHKHNVQTIFIVTPFVLK